MVFSFDNSIHPHSRAEWRRWLEQHHERPEGVWLIFSKKGSGLPEVTYDEAVEEALCFGWVDSKPATIDDKRHGQWFAPRKAKSAWSKPNKERVERLVVQGLMRPAGQVKIDQARQDGSWDTLNDVDAMIMPPDLAEALAGYADAARHWEAFPPSAKKAILYWIGSAKRPETRQARVEETARLASENKRANQWVPPDKR